MTKKLYRSQTDKIIAGVCGGLAEYFNIDSTIVRLIFAFIIIMPIGGGLLIYLVLWLIMPKKPDEPAIVNKENIKEFIDEVKGRAGELKDEFKKDAQAEEKSKIRLASENNEIRKRRGNLLGWFLIVLGIIFLVNTIFPILFRATGREFYCC